MFGYAATITGRGVSFLVALVTIPLTLPYLGPERFGMWMTINSLVTLLGFTNLGVGLSLMNAIAQKSGDSASHARRTSISNALAISLAVATVLFVLCLVAMPLVPWWQILNVSSPMAIAEAGPAVAAVALTFIVAMPVGLSISIWNGLQKTYVPGLLAGLGPLIGIVGVAVGVFTHQGVPFLVLAASAGPLLAAAIGGVLLFRTHVELRPARRLVSSRGIQLLLGVGLSFLLLQVAIAVANNSDQLVLAQVVGPPAVAEYSVVSPLYNVPLVLAVTFVTVLWPGFSDAWGRGDLEWIRTAHRRVVLVALGITVPSVVALAVGGPFLVRFLTEGRIVPDFGLFLAFGCATVAVVLASTESVFLNTAGIVWPLVVCWIVMAGCNIILGVWLSARVGASGVVWATAITEGIMLIPMLGLARRLPDRQARVDKVQHA